MEEFRSVETLSAFEYIGTWKPSFHLAEVKAGASHLSSRFSTVQAMTRQAPSVLGGAADIGDLEISEDSAGEIST